MITLSIVPIPVKLSTSDLHNIKNQFTNNYSQNRKKEYWASRKAVLTCLKEYKINSNWKSLEIENYNRLKKYPNILISISHTKNLAVCLMTQRNEFTSIGIDIENSKRTVNHKILKFYCNEEDNDFQNPLHLWVKKEASYKALFPIINKLKIKKALVLKDIWIKSNLFGIIGKSNPLGNIEISSIKYLNENFFLGKAIISTNFY